MSAPLPPAVTCRPITAADIPAAHTLSARVGWSHRLEDWAMLQRLADGFVCERAGQVVGSSFACHQGDFSLIGLVIVDDAYQGLGIGRRLMELALATVAPRTALLNATPAGAPMYLKMGFREYARIEQWQGVATPLAAAGGTRDLRAADRSRLHALASAGSGLQRGAVLDEVLASALQGIGVEHEGQVASFALLRPFGRGLSIGPVIARDEHEAWQLVCTLLSRVAGEFVRIDIAAGYGLSERLAGAGLECVASAAQMTLGSAPQARGGVQQFALITQATG